MNDFTASDQDVNRAIKSWLHEDRHEDVSRVAGAVLDQVETIKQRRATWWPARRTPNMSKIIGFGLAAAAGVVAAVIGLQLLGSPNVGGPGLEPSSTPEPTSSPEPTPTSELTPSPTAKADLPDGPFVVTGVDDPVQVTIRIASPGWNWLPQFDAVDKGDDGLDPPETVGGALLAWAWPAGTAFDVYGDPCQWSTTIPETPATTPDEIAAALAAQSSREASAPVDVTVGGYAGKAITLHVPMSYEVPGATREEEFAACDQSVFGSYGIAGNEPEPERNHQGPGQVDDLWILDVDGSIVILDAMYGPAVPADLVEELQALAESATFEAP